MGTLQWRNEWNESKPVPWKSSRPNNSCLVWGGWSMCSFPFRANLPYLVGGWTNPSEKYYSSKWVSSSSPIFGVKNTKIFELPPPKYLPAYSLLFFGVLHASQAHVMDHTLKQTSQSSNLHPFLGRQKLHFFWNNRIIVSPSFIGVILDVLLEVRMD